MSVQSDELEPSAQQDIAPQDTPLASTFIPMPTTGRTERQTIRQSVQQQQHEPAILSWPSSSGSPINEFTILRATCLALFLLSFLLVLLTLLLT